MKLGADLIPFVRHGHFDPAATLYRDIADVDDIAGVDANIFLARRECPGFDVTPVVGKGTSSRTIYREGPQRNLETPLCCCAQGQPQGLPLHDGTLKRRGAPRGRPDRPHTTGRWSVGAPLVGALILGSYPDIRRRQAAILIWRRRYEDDARGLGKDAAR